MRGRTNVGGGGGISINATVERKTIKSGDIVAGDFVEYYTEPTSISLNNTVNFKFMLGSYAIGVLDGALIAIKDGVHIDTYLAYNCTYVCKYENWIIFHDCVAGMLGVLSIDNDEFVLVDSYQTNFTTPSSSYKISICANDGKICFYFHKTSTETYIGVADISETGEISNYVLTTLSVNDGDAFEMCYSNGFYLINRVPSTRAFYIRIYPVLIDVNNEATIGTLIAQKYYTTTSSGAQANIGVKVWEKDAIIGVSYIKTIVEGSSSVGNEGFIDFINFVTGSFVTKKLNNYGQILTYISNSCFLATEKERIYYMHSNYRYIAKTLSLCHLDENTFDITIVGSITLDDDYEHVPQYSEGDYIYNRFNYDYEHNLGICDDTYIYGQVKVQEKVIWTSSSSRTYQTIYDYNLYMYEEINGHFQDKAQVDYVQPYSANAPIGVAKEAGTTNDIIDVYVPSNSY